MNLVETIELHLPRGFKIQGQLGRGGTALVYVAGSADGEERLVVKVMLPGTAKPDAVDRFLREMQILKTLDHPRIIPLLEPGEANGAFFFTMPYIAGETLAARLKACGPLSVRETLLIVRDIAGALGHAHGRGVVHRDVKPANVLLAADAAYLMDFGFASAPGVAAGGPGSDESRFIVGTPEYMSPEQVEGKTAADWRSDFFSLGCMMHEMLTGQVPFAASPARASLTRRLAATAPGARALPANVPEDVAAIIRRTLAPHPSGRFATAGFLSSAIDAALERLGDG